MKKRILLLILVLAAPLFLAKSAFATVYFYYGSESQTSGQNLPSEDEAYGGTTLFCHDGCGGTPIMGTVQSLGGAPEGSNYFQWVYPGGALDNLRVEARDTAIFNNTVKMDLIVGETYYFATFFNMDRSGNGDIYQEGYLVDSYDKDIQFCDSGCTILDSVSWSASHGQIAECGESGGFAANTDGHFTIWLGNTNKNTLTDNYNVSVPNQNSYSCVNPIQLAYDVWHSTIMAIKISDCGVTNGRIQLWVDGVLTHDYDNIITADYDGDRVTCDPEIGRLQFGGTIAQPDHTAAEHLRKYDAVMLTDNWQDIVDGGYILTETPIETCTDSIQNQDETGIDCGGACEACVIPTTYGLSNFISAITNWLGIGDSNSDVNSDGVVNTRDLGVIMSSWGE